MSSTLLANRITLTTSYSFSFDTVGPVFQELPDYLAETKYSNITDNGKTVIQKAYNMDLPGFVWFPNQPKRFAYFQQVMTVQRAGALDWLSVFPVEKAISGWSAHSDKALLVDVGGGFGHQCLAFRAKYPKLPGRLIPQDIPQTLEHVRPMESVEKMVQIFFRTAGYQRQVALATLRNHEQLAFPLPLMLTMLQAQNSTTYATFCMIGRMINTLPS